MGRDDETCFRRSACLRYLICACISLKNINLDRRSTTDSRRGDDCILSRFLFAFSAFYRLFLYLCVAYVVRMNFATRQSAICHDLFAIAINKPRCIAQSRDLITFFLSVCCFICDTEAYRICDRSIALRSSRFGISLFFFFPFALRR